MDDYRGEVLSAKKLSLGETQYEPHMALMGYQTQKP